jgi:WD40 repeat protein
MKSFWMYLCDIETLKNIYSLWLVLMSYVCCAVLNEYNVVLSFWNWSCAGWTDCCIRGYYPESGKPMYVAKKAYGTMVTAIAAYRNCRFIISGSDIGHVVVWKLPDQVNLKSDEIPHATLHFILKEHKARVTAIRVNKDDSACVTSSIDGSCIIWNLRSVCIFSQFERTSRIAVMWAIGL